MIHCRLYQGFGRRLSVLTLELFAQGAGIDANSDGDTFISRAVNHLTDLFHTSDITGIDAQTINTVLSYRQRYFMIEVSVGHQRNINASTDVPERFSRLHTRNRNSNNVGPGIR